MNTSVETPLPHPGMVISGKYRLVRLLGEGGMGVVFEAEHQRLKQRVAIKVLQPARSGKRDAARFLREARAASQLVSHHVAKVLDVDELQSGLPYMVMEYLDGCDLENELANRGRLLIPEAVDYVIQACAAVAEAHERGIVHRDLKPSNLFLCDHGVERIVKVLDFGISKMADEASVTVTATSLGTPLYMSPEQIRDAKEVDQRSDIWSLGVILFELLTGTPPFEGAGGATAVSVAIAMDPPPWLRTLRTDVPPELEQVVMRMLEKDRGERFQAIADVAEALQPFASDPNLPGRVRISQLPRTLSARPSARIKRTASTVSGSRIDSAWTTDSRSPKRSRFAYYAIGTAAFVLGGGLTAAILGPALLKPPEAEGGPSSAVSNGHGVAMPPPSAKRIVAEISAAAASASAAPPQPSLPRPSPPVSAPALPKKPPDDAVPSPVDMPPEAHSTSDDPRTSPPKNPIRL